MQTGTSHLEWNLAKSNKIIYALTFWLSNPTSRNLLEDIPPQISKYVYAHGYLWQHLKNFKIQLKETNTHIQESDWVNQINATQWRVNGENLYK